VAKPSKTKEFVKLDGAFYIQDGDHRN